MTRDKKRYIEALLYNYKDNKTRLIVLEEGLVNDDDFILGSIDYSKERVQNSNLSSLDDKVIAREREIEKLKKDIRLTEVLLDKLSEKEYKVITSFYIKKIPNRLICEIIDRTDEKTVWRIKNNALISMARAI